MPMNDARPRLIQGRAPNPDDERVWGAVESLPAPAVRYAHERQRAGIVNEEGCVYREVDVFSLLELMHLTARMNTLGYRLAPELREFLSRRYSVVYARRQRAQPQ